MSTLIVNLFGGPGISKSTTAAGLFHLLKAAGSSCELVNEFAKEKTWERNSTALADQFYVTANQHYKQHILKDKVDVIVTDSPILLGIFYYDEKDPVIRNAYTTFVTETFKRQNNLNILLRRKKLFVQEGRNHNEEECKRIDVEIKEFLKTNNIPYLEIDGDSLAPTLVFESVKEYFASETIRNLVNQYGYFKDTVGKDVECK